MGLTNDDGKRQQKWIFNRHFASNSMRRFSIKWLKSVLWTMRMCKKLLYAQSNPCGNAFIRIESSSSCEWKPKYWVWYHLTHGIRQPNTMGTSQAIYFYKPRAVKIESKMGYLSRFIEIINALLVDEMVLWVYFSRPYR